MGPLGKISLIPLKLDLKEEEMEFNEEDTNLRDIPERDLFEENSRGVC